jgi:predicted metal-binding membrane protein
LSETPAVERILKREQAIAVAGVLLLCVLAWIYLLTGAGMGMSLAESANLALFPHTSPAHMADMEMPGRGWSPAVFSLVAAMWWIMMVAMMTPSAAPTILLYARVRRHALTHQRADGIAPTAAFAGTYLVVWLAFSLLATLAQWGLERAELTSVMMMGSQSKWLSATVLVAAGAYQLSPLKNLCLSRCRSPASFLSKHWRPGPLAAVRLGVRHGAYCVGCCWMLMVLLFVGGVMNIAWIAAITVLVLAEKLAPRGPWIGRAAGVLLIAWGAATAFV